MWRPLSRRARRHRLGAVVFQSPSHRPGARARIETRAGLPRQTCGTEWPIPSLTLAGGTALALTARLRAERSSD
eukprot:4707005-Pyramimonas_sp.AAC.1